MDARLIIAGMACLVLAAGHAVIGWRWVLPKLGDAQLPATPFGPASLTRGMVRFTWHAVTLVLLAFAAIFVLLAGDTADVETTLLRWLALFWVAATATAAWDGRRRPSSLVLFPVPLLFAAIAALSWVSAT